MKIDKYIRNNGQATLGSTPTLQQVQVNTVNGITTYYPTYLSTDGNFSVLYETVVDSSGNVQIVSVNKKALNVGHHLLSKRHNLRDFAKRHAL